MSPVSVRIIDTFGRESNSAWCSWKQKFEKAASNLDLPAGIIQMLISNAHLPSNSGLWTHGMYTQILTSMERVWCDALKEAKLWNKIKRLVAVNPANLTKKTSFGWSSYFIGIEISITPIWIKRLGKESDIGFISSQQCFPLFSFYRFHVVQRHRLDT